MIPEIRFMYSRPHDDRMKEILEWKYKATNNPDTKKSLDEYPSEEEIHKYIKSIIKILQKDENKILSSMSKITGLKWKQKYITCFVVGRCRPYSIPLTVRVYKSKTKFIDTLTHELIHNIQVQNKDLYKKWNDHIKIKYKDEPFSTKAHIFLHAVHKQIYLEIFSKQRLKRDIVSCQKSPDYARAWQIVEKEGYENIIKEFKKAIKE